MHHQHYTHTMLASQTPEQVFDVINDVRGWWSQDYHGQAQKIADEFEVRFGDMHYSRHKVVELVPGKKIAWLVTASQLHFLKNKNEWDGTKNIFEITREAGQTKIVFTHEGLVPALQCFNDCSNGWNYYLQSLFNLITGGKGHPQKK